MGQMIGLGAYIGFTGAALGAAIILWLWRHLP
jgi:hypothetical protein